MGAVYNPLFQNKRRMVASGICTVSQYESGVIKLVDHMYLALEHLDLRKNLIVVSDNKNLKNKWDDDTEVMFRSPSSKKDAKYLEEFHQFSQGRYLPKMKDIKNSCNI